VNAQSPEVTHNTWTTGTAMPTARMGAAAVAFGKNIYVIGGYYVNDITGVNEIYNTKTHSWTNGAPDPAVRAFVAYAVVNKILYIFGGSNGSEILNVTESYNPATNTWTTLAPMPFSAETGVAVADKDVIYVMGGQVNGGYLTNVASYNTTTNTWTEEAPLLVATGWQAVGLFGKTIVSADGANNADYLGSEGYNIKENTWADLPSDPMPRIVGCSAVIKGELYVAGGNNGSSLTLNESYNPKTQAWTTLAPMPNGTDNEAASAVSGGRMYCFGGGLFDQVVYNNVQIYQP
jgi:N-acetylneuraminic acid mutarotase